VEYLGDAHGAGVVHGHEPYGRSQSVSYRIFTVER
jgi:hypothetical protein